MASNSAILFAPPLHLAKRPLNPARLARSPLLFTAIRHASNKKPQLDKSRILEKPTRFNPPSHGARRVKPRMFPGPKPTMEEQEFQSTKRYPNMLPAEGTFMHWFLTNRAVHAWITLSVLFVLAIYSLSLSFLNSTTFRDELPSSQDFMSHPFQSIGEWVRIYRMHVQHESEVVAEKRRKKLEDAEKRKVFMRAHGVEPGFLTGSWMDKFGTIEGDEAREALQRRMDAEREQQAKGIDEQSPITDQAAGAAAVRGEQPKRKLWLGIW